MSRTLRLALALITCANVSACAAAPAVTIKRASGEVVTMPADVYAHSLSVEAYAAKGLEMSATMPANERQPD